MSQWYRHIGLELIIQYELTTQGTEDNKIEVSEMRRLKIKELAEQRGIYSRSLCVG